uniref:Major facilitator superfamily (MFS) profile domain-containing protein n=1 Tax=Periophthalmus magnuspinnatus TaxID=409849 RepID=A0A3B4AQ80_9GOBI
ACSVVCSVVCSVACSLDSVFCCMFCCVFCCLFCCVFFCLFCCVFCCVLCCLFCCVFCCMFSVCCCRIGGERVLLMSAASWGVITAGTPLMARLCSRTLFLMTTARFLMGLLQGVFFPSLASLCSHRVVKAERGFLMSILHSGTYLGTLVAGGLGSVMLQSYGWEYLFYCIGFSSGLWALLIWYFLVKGREIPKQKHVENGRPHSKTRWLSFIKKPPVCAFVCRSMMIAHTCAASTFYTLLSWLPTYFEESFPNAKGGVYNTVPKTSLFKSDVTVSHGYEPNINSDDLAPSCAGALYGFMNMMGALTGVVTVSLSGYLIEVTQTWATVFSLVALINSSGLGVYLVFGDAQRLDQGSPVTII